jgi:hypothetical protein
MANDSFFDGPGTPAATPRPGPVPAAAGRPARYDHEYVRNGTANVFLFCEALAGKRHVRLTAPWTKVDWAQRVRELVDQTYPRAEKVVPVMDHLHTRAPASPGR